MSITTSRRRFVASSVIVCPMISGVFFGLVAALLAARSEPIGHGIAIGILVGGVMFASNAVALCIVQSSVRNAPAKRAATRVHDATDARTG